MTKIITYLIVLFLSFTTVEAQNCQQTMATATPDPQSNLCCFQLNLENGLAQTFTDIRLTPLGQHTFTNVSFDPSWNFSINDPTEIRFFPSSGFVPTGTFTPISFCLDNQGTPPQLIQIEWLDPNGVICVDTIETNCARCIDLDFDQLVCGAGGLYDFDFTFTNLNDNDIYRLEIDYLTPNGSTSSPQSINFNSSPVAPGATESGNRFSFSIPSGNPQLEFTIRAFGEFDCCQCVSDTIRLDIPNCCEDPCDQVNYSLEPLNPISEYCCYSLDIFDVCDDMYFSGLRIDLPSPLYFRSQVANNGWQLTNISDSSVIWRPRSVITGSPFLPIGDILGNIEFCLAGITNPSQVPQNFTISFLTGPNDQVACEFEEETLCDPLIPGDCVIIKDDSLYCGIEDGAYQLDWALENVGNFEATKIRITSISISNSLANVNLSPQILSNLNFSPGDVIQMPSAFITNANPGDRLCFALSLIDSASFQGVQECCHTDTFCFIMPECDLAPPCEQNCELNYVELTTSSDSDYCCYNLSFSPFCEETYSSIDIEVLDGAHIRSISSPIDVGITNFSATQKRINPRVFYPSYPFFSNTDTISGIQFCLGGINNSNQVPQRIVIHWNDTSGQVLCSDTLITDCEPLTPGDCVVVINDTVTCEGDSFRFAFDLVNVGNFQGEYIRVGNFHSSNAGISVLPSLLDTSYTFPQGDTFDISDIIISNGSPGDTVCYTVSIFDDVDSTGYNQCCHTDTLCFVLPTCESETNCEAACESTSLQIVPNGDLGTCCYDLTASTSCPRSFYGIRLSGLQGVSFQQIYIDSPFQLVQTSTDEVIIQPTIQGSMYPFIGDTISVSYCLSNISHATQIVIAEWIDSTGQVICVDSLLHECEIENEPCVVVVSDSVVCAPPGHYTYYFQAQNLGSFTGQHITVGPFFSKPAGASIVPSQIDTSFIFGPGDVYNSDSIHINGAYPGDTLCYVISVYDTINPSTGCTRICNSDTICYILPDCGNESICEQVSFDTASTQGDCCYSLVIDNQYSGSYFTELQLISLTSGVTISVASTNPDWTISPVSGGYSITYTGPGSPNIPIGQSIPITYCLSGYSSIPQTIELLWITPDENGIPKVECCQGLYLGCTPPSPSTPCATVSEMSSECQNDSVYVTFTLTNQTNLGQSAPGYPINMVTFHSITPGSALLDPSPYQLSPALAVGASRQIRVKVSNYQLNSTLHFSVGVHLMQQDSLDCCTGDSLYCVNLPICEPISNPICEDVVLDSLPYEGWAVASCGIWYRGLPTDPVVAMYNLYNHQNAPRNVDWTSAPGGPAKIMGINGNIWDFQTLGNVFGLAVDPYRSELFVASGSYYSSRAHWGIARAPAIYKIDLQTGTILPLVVTQNSSAPNHPTYDNFIPNQISPLTRVAPAFGNIAMNSSDRILYASNREDGVIYAIDASTGTVLGGIDPWSFDNGSQGAAPVGERIDGIQYHPSHRKVYFSRTVEDLSSFPNTSMNQEIWSVSIRPDGLPDVSSLQFEFSVSSYLGTADFSEPITDIAFSANGLRMLLAERGDPHKARTLEYTWDGSTWNPEPTQKYQVGTFFQQTNSAGGVDFTYTNNREFATGCDLDEIDQTVLASGNALRFDRSSSYFVYGIQGIPNSGGGTLQSFLIDLDGNTTNVFVKGTIGDVESITNYCCELVSTTVQKPSKLKVYPNPASERIHFSSPLDAQYIHIWNMQGQLVLKRDGFNGNHIPVHSLTPGSYFIQVLQKDGEVLTAKFIKVGR